MLATDSAPSGSPDNNEANEANEMDQSVSVPRFPLPAKISPDSLLGEAMLAAEPGKELEKEVLFFIRPGTSEQEARKLIAEQAPGLVLGDDAFHSGAGHFLARGSREAIAAAAELADASGEALVKYVLLNSIGTRSAGMAQERGP